MSELELVENWNDNGNIDRLVHRKLDRLNRHRRNRRRQWQTLVSPVIAAGDKIDSRTFGRRRKCERLDLIINVRNLGMRSTPLRIGGYNFFQMAITQRHLAGK